LALPATRRVSIQRKNYQANTMHNQINEQVTLDTTRNKSMSVDYVDDRRAIQNTMAGYAQLAASRVSDGWHPQIATMMFSHLPGKPNAVLAQMFDEAERVYRTFVTRVVRRPLSHKSIGDLPIMITAPDFPVSKTNKPLAQVVLNNGLHLHAILLVPPRARLPIPAQEHFRQHQALYVRDRSRLDRVDVRPIENGVERAVEYVLKSLRRRRFTPDDLLLLPRALAELRD
jgi:hypothetical protein